MVCDSASNMMSRQDSFSLTSEGNLYPVVARSPTLSPKSFAIFLMMSSKDFAIKV